MKINNYFKLIYFIFAKFQLALITVFVHRQSKLFVVRDSEDDRGGEITGLAIRIVLKSQLLFVTTRNALFAYEIAVKDKFLQVSTFHIHTL